jgi:hypothetical protein
MTINPYQSPLEISKSATAPRNTIGTVGFMLSTTGLVGLQLATQGDSVIGAVGRYMVLLCLPGIVTSLIGYNRTPHKLARWGLALGIIGALYLPTLFHGIIMGAK